MDTLWVSGILLALAGIVLMAVVRMASRIDARDKSRAAIDLDMANSQQRMSRES